MIAKLKNLGPGLLFAGAAIGVSHLVQSTRAGADFGMGLLWALLLVNLCKYPFFQFGPRYATATGESLLDGYKKLGKGVLLIYYILNLATMFTIQTAVTIVTAGLAANLFGHFDSFSIGNTIISSTEIWTMVILLVCVALLTIGKYKLLDRLMKVIVITLTISTFTAVSIALSNTHQPVSLIQIIPDNSLDIAFLIAFMGWMPAPLDVSVWQSLWAVQKHKDTKTYTPEKSLFDFNIGYLSTIIIGIGFLLLGTLVMYKSGESFSSSASVFSGQLINMYTKNLGNWAYIIIGIAAFTTMFSTTLTTLDASPRAMSKATQLLFKKADKLNYTFWISILTIGSICIFLFLASEMGLLIQLATILSFVTAPFFSIINYKLISSKHTPVAWRPSKKLHILSWLGIIFLIGFSIWYLTTL
ncbi:Nramp family divalent metal transporter [Aestuariibaculum suncheonense]|uniref:Nramp family divalent metal transporter n=1 Tax=Aestuariibaculum suncheonense TaxID=1028745 RepID=A0A8J6QH66_9FLAO|nr:Nramp family divalent metal transporter [Aestuariibaculum suncheonense]MBD0836433.1 Nramp family divalent metal transporter [Aestuariibaculum suncheonense]